MIAEREEAKRAIRRYVSGEMSDEERERFEERYFADTDFFQEVVEYENDMLDRRADGAATGDERRSLARSTISGSIASERGVFARAFARYARRVSRNATTRRIDRRVAGIAAAAAVAV